MKSRRNRLALVAAVVGSALLTACSSVGTGAFVPTPVKQPASHYDLMHYQSSASRNMLHRAATAPGPGGVFDYRYY